MDDDRVAALANLIPRIDDFDAMLASAPEVTFTVDGGRTPDAAVVDLIGSASVPEWEAARDVIAGAHQYRLLQAQRLLDAYAEANGRPAKTTEELEAWLVARTQDDEETT